MNEEVEIHPARLSVLEDETPQVNVRPVYHNVEITAPGPQGPPGPPGPVGGSRYVHTQNTPAAVWSVGHGLGYEPLFATVIIAGEDVTDGVDIYHTDSNNLTITFSQPQIGKAAFL